jgi:hypothetical protein
MSRHLIQRTRSALESCSGSGGFLIVSVVLTIGGWIGFFATVLPHLQKAKQCAELTVVKGVCVNHNEPAYLHAQELRAKIIEFNMATVTDLVEELKESEATVRNEFVYIDDFRIRGNSIISKRPRSVERAIVTLVAVASTLLFFISLYCRRS